MNRKKAVSLALSGVLALGAGLTAGTSALAADNSTNMAIEKSRYAMNAWSDETKEKFQTIQDELRYKLTEIGVELPERGQHKRLFPNFDEETKAKVAAIREQVKEGTITPEAADEMLTKLGVEKPQKWIPSDRLDGLDDETTAQVQAIRDGLNEGTITKEVAQQQFAELGIGGPLKGKVKHRDFLENLDEDTKAKAQELIDAAKSDLEELGIERVPFQR